MSIRTVWNQLPKLPLSALLFYIAVYVLWQLSIIPSPTGIIVFLESLYNNYGLLGLFISSLLEGLVYVGLYFPGSFILALAVLVSDGSPASLFALAAVATAATTSTIVINYCAGRYLIIRKQPPLPNYEKPLAKQLSLAIVHPNILAFYCFNHGIHKRSPLPLLITPFLLLPYSFIVISIISLFRDAFRSQIENPYVMLMLLMIWIVAAIVLQSLEKKKSKNDAHHGF